MNKIIKIIGSLLVVVLILFGYIFYQEKDHNLTVAFFDVGQGDAILIKTPSNQKILIDGGPDNTLVNKLGPYFNFSDQNIDLIILTHAHSDHLMGLVEVLKRYQVKKILYTGVVQTTPEYLEWLKIIKEKNTSFKIAQAGQQYDFMGGVNLEILFPLEDLTNKKFEDLNQSSIVCRLQYKNSKWLFMGDLPKEQELEMIRTGENLEANILKVGHHGSKYSTAIEFLKTVKAEISVIPVGVDNKFGHPSSLIISRLQKAGLKILRTDEIGDIILISDGFKIWQK